MREEDKLKRRIYALSFAMWELHLYLDSHPEDCDAAKKLREYTERSDTLTEEYESKYGTLTETSDKTNRWEWINSPWPWDLEV